METYAIKNLSFRYPETGIDVLKDITFSVNEGEFITCLLYTSDAADD